MSELAIVIVTSLTTVLTSGGLWSYLQYRSNKNSYERTLMKGVAYTILIQQCTAYIKRGKISSSEYVELTRMLYDPYKGLGGNGSAERAFDIVRSLPITDSDSIDDARDELEERRRNGG